LLFPAYLCLLLHRSLILKFSLLFSFANLEFSYEVLCFFGARVFDAVEIFTEVFLAEAVYFIAKLVLDGFFV
jgi:hypothetical protein